jgi:hypothetical protein
MRYVCLIAMTALALGATAKADPTDQTSKADTLANSLQAIQSAQDPSAAIEAYVAALHIDVNDPQVYEVYIKRMLDFMLPDLVTKPAETLVRLKPDSGLGWAVQGFGMGRQGKMVEAFEDEVRALSLAPKDPFVLQFAAQLVSWYDHQPEPAKLPAAIIRDVAVLRQHDSEPAFQDAYAMTSDVLTQAYPSQETVGPEFPSALPQDQYNYPPASPSYNYYYYSPPVYTPYPYDNAYGFPGYAYSYGYPYSYSYYGSPYYYREYSYPQYHAHIGPFFGRHDGAEVGHGPEHRLTPFFRGPRQDGMGDRERGSSGSFRYFGREFNTNRAPSFQTHRFPEYGGHRGMRSIPEGHQHVGSAFHSSHAFGGSRMGSFRGHFGHSAGGWHGGMHSGREGHGGRR